MSGFLIKSYHSPDGTMPRRVHFWQTPWVVECNPYVAQDDYGDTVTRTSREIGGWVTYSGAGTVYPSMEEAMAVRACRGLDGDITDADRYLQPKL